MFRTLQERIEIRLKQCRSAIRIIKDKDDKLKAMLQQEKKTLTLILKEIDEAKSFDDIK
jgi:hypothetical protein